MVDINKYIKKVRINELEVSFEEQEEINRYMEKQFQGETIIKVMKKIILIEMIVQSYKDSIIKKYPQTKEQIRILREIAEKGRIDIEFEKQN